MIHTWVSYPKLIIFGGDGIFNEAYGFTYRWPNLWSVCLSLGFWYVDFIMNGLNNLPSFSLMMWSMENDWLVSMRGFTIKFFSFYLTSYWSWHSLTHILSNQASLWVWPCFWNNNPLGFWCCLYVKVF